ncbi:MAG: hypothetical protein JWO38_5653 [Gemmataceae bacterium]|nr:hypothetical protein [Gemmataceae bacterium]
MAADHEPPTLADYAVTAVSPALIMLMVGSLVFFLVTVLPTGEYKERLLYTTFFFVFGAVLVARIAIQYDSARATMYGLGLGVVTFLAMSAYVEYPSGTWLKSAGWLVNIGLMGLIWWSAHKLTWDCTHVDENRDASGRGLLSAAGLPDGEGGNETESNTDTADEDSKPGAAKEQEKDGAQKPKKKGKKKRKKQSAFSAWTARWWAHHDKQKDKPHTPGVWVIYFSLAALPLFAIGQSLIPPDDDDRRRATFLQMAVYVGSGLGLLVTTSLLGLRRYLRQRKAKVPGSLTAGWLGLGGVLIVVFLTLGAFLPRPHSEVPWFGLQRPGKSEREASRYAQLRDSAGKGEGAEGNVSEKGDGTASGKNGERGGSKGQKGSGGKGQGKGNSGGKGEKSDGGRQGEDDQSKTGDDQDKNGDDQKKSEDDSSSKDKGGSNAETSREGKDAKGRAGERDRSTGRSAPDTKIGGAVGKIAGFLKWVVVAIVVFIVIAAVVVAILRYLAPFTDWARNLLDALRSWWAGLFGKKRVRAREEAEVVAPLGPVRPPPFHTFSNPFGDGTADGRDPAELVEYTFAALDAWAWDRGHGRELTETPMEFAARLGEGFPDFAANLRRLANLYARVAYSTSSPPDNTPQFLEQVWDQLVHGADVVAAGESV